MISVILIWLYMLFTCYVSGYGVLKLCIGKERFQLRRRTSYLYAGIGAVTVYAQLFSIFWKVGLLANLILLFFCILCIFRYGKELLADFHALRLSVTPLKIVVVLLLFFLFAYGTSTGMIHYDTSLYHAQSIRWIEEFGVVPGLGNLHSRLAYNSASFCLSALYSMAFLGGRSYHCCAGFLAFLLALICMELFSPQRIKTPRLSDMARIMGIYYLLMIFDEMVSPASDYFLVLLVFYIVIRWLDLLEWGERSYLPYGLLSVLSVLAVTVKLSGALLLLLALKPAWMLLREKHIREICRFTGMGLVVAVPFFVRNVILSGWLVYPFTAIDWFSFDFKIPRAVADYDAKEIQVWGRGFSDVTRYGEPLKSWFGEWFRGLGKTEQGFMVLALSGILVLICLCLYAFRRKNQEMYPYLHTSAVLCACFLFWLCSAPLLRYGCVFLYLTVVLTWGFLYLKISPHLDRYRIYLVILLIMGIYKLGAFGIELKSSATTENLLLQKDYENYATVPYEIHGYIFYYPLEGDRTGYRDFPSSPIKAEDIFRGDTIEEGFRDVVHLQSEKN